MRVVINIYSCQCLVEIYYINKELYLFSIKKYD